MPEIKEALARHGYTADNLPAGAVVAISQLSDCHKVNGIEGYIAASIGNEYRITEGKEFAFLKNIIPLLKKLKRNCNW